MLSLLSTIYAKVADLRNRLYDRGVFETHDLGARTISIGNITTGGTGKTPLVAYVARVLADRGEKVCILTRGYGRENSSQRILVSDGENILADVRKAGDEPLELAEKLLGKAIVIADADRVAAAEWARRKFGVTAFVLDDGFQHRKAKRDLDIVCIDATNPFGGGKMLPAGRLREPLHHLARADIVVVTRADLVDDISNLRSEISELNPKAAVFAATNEISKIEELRDGAKLDKDEKTPAFAFCGLGNPDGFFELLERNNIDVAGRKIFRDHHAYSPSDIETLQNEAHAAQAAVLFTTAKDAVKLSTFNFQILCYVVDVEVKIDDPTGFASLL